MEEQLYCISARNRATNVTEVVRGPFTKQIADDFQASTFVKKTHLYFRVSKWPFKVHKKNGRL